MNDLVSIIMPVLNSEKYVEEAIKSCFDQTYSNIEIIVVDGNSTDDTLEILNSYSDRITVLTEPKRGIGVAINRGIRSMKGTWFKVMNADDILYPECVEILISEIKKLKNKNVIIHSNCDIIDSNGKFVREWLQPNFNSLSNFEQNVILLDHNTIINITTLLPKDIFSKYGYYDETTIAEDYELWLRLSLLFNFRRHLLERKLVKYRRHETSTTVKALKKTPDYGDHPRNLVLQKLDPLTRKKYESSLKLIKKQNKKSIPIRTKEKIDHLVLNKFSPSTAKKFRYFYRTIIGKEKKN